MISCSGDIRDQVAKLSEIAPKLDVFGPPNYGGKGPPKFLTEFYKSGSSMSMWQHLVTIRQATSEIRRRKKKDLNYSGKTEWPVLTIIRAAIINDIVIYVHITEARCSFTL